MKKRLAQIRADFCSRVPNKFKSLLSRKKSRQGSSVTKISPVESKPGEHAQTAKKEEAKVNKGFEDSEVHPFQITG